MSALDLSSLDASNATTVANDVSSSLNQADQRVVVGVFKQEPLTKKYIFNADDSDVDRVRIVSKLNSILNFSTPELLKIRSEAKSNEAVSKRRVIEIKKGVRGTEIYNEAVRYGAQVALASTINDFVLGINKRQSELRNIYDFQSLMLNNGTIAPPVVSISKGVVNVTGDVYQRIATSYRVSAQAKFVGTPITFFDYFNFQDYEIVDPSKFDVPLTENEMNYWRNGVYDGWIAGTSQASMEIASSENRLNRDYLGMIRYRVMLLGNMIDKPHVSKNSRSTDVSPDAMDIGKVTLSMSDKIKFNPDDSVWVVLPRLDKLEESSLVSPNQEAL